MIHAIYDAQNTCLANQVEVPLSAFAKMKGLLPYKEIPNNFAMVFENAKQIHMFFMRTAIDVMYLDEQQKVLFVGTIKPWRIGPYLRKTKWIVEGKKGAFSHVKVGDMIYLHT